MRVETLPAAFNYILACFGSFSISRLPVVFWTASTAAVAVVHRTRVIAIIELTHVTMQPANIVPGMGFSPDKRLQARIISYPDAHRYRLGVNYDGLPVNRPRGCPVHTYHRDGAMRFDENGGIGPNYEPNSFGGPVEDHRYREPFFPISGEIGRHDHREGNDDYTQPGNLFRLMTADAKARLIDNIVTSIGPATHSGKTGRAFLQSRPGLWARRGGRAGIEGRGNGWRLKTHSPENRAPSASEWVLNRTKTHSLSFGAR